MVPLRASPGGEGGCETIRSRRVSSRLLRRTSRFGLHSGVFGTELDGRFRLGLIFAGRGFGAGLSTDSRDLPAARTRLGRAGKHDDGGHRDEGDGTPNGL